MANSKANTINIPLVSGVILDENKTKIAPYAGYIQNNGGAYGGNLAPYYAKIDECNDAWIVDDENNLYTFEVAQSADIGTIKRNGLPLGNASAYGIKIDVCESSVVSVSLVLDGENVTVWKLSLEYNIITVTDGITTYSYNGYWNYKNVGQVVLFQNSTSIIIYYASAEVRLLEIVNGQYVEFATTTVVEGFNLQYPLAAVKTIGSVTGERYHFCFNGVPLHLDVIPFLKTYSKLTAAWTTIDYVRYIGGNGDIGYTGFFEYPFTSYPTETWVNEEIRLFDDALRKVFVRDRANSIYSGAIYDWVVGSGFYCLIASMYQNAGLAADWWCRTCFGVVGQEAVNQSFPLSKARDDYAENDDPRFVSGVGDGIRLPSLMGFSTSLNKRFNILVNNGKVTGISVNEDASRDTGVLVAPYGTVQQDSLIGAAHEFSFYTNTNGRLVVIESTKNIELKDRFQLLSGDLIQLNTISSYNIISGTKLQIGSCDWNNRVFLAAHKGITETDKLKYVSVASGYNANYESSPELKASGGSFAPLILQTTEGDIDKDNVIHADSNETNIDIYKSPEKESTEVPIQESIIPEYWVTLRNDGFFVNPDLVGLIYPQSTVLSLYFPTAITSKFRKGIALDTMVTFNEQGTWLFTYDNIIHANYYAVNTINKAGAIFSLYGRKYLHDERNIYAINVLDGILQSIVPISPSFGLKFIGSTPSEAIFLSPLDKEIVVFSGDNKIKPVQSANAINEIYAIGYNMAEQITYIATDIGVVTIQAEGAGIFEYTNIIDIYTTIQGTVFKTADNKMIQWAWRKKEGFELVPLHFKTAYYGEGNSIVSNYDCLRIRFYNKDRTTGKVYFRVSTITDIAATSDIKEITINDWDSNDSYIYRYQPPLQKGVGISFEVISDFAISEMDLSHIYDSLVITAEKTKGSIK